MGLPSKWINVLKLKYVGSCVLLFLSTTLDTLILEICNTQVMTIYHGYTDITIVEDALNLDIIAC